MDVNGVVIPELISYKIHFLMGCVARAGDVALGKFTRGPNVQNNFIVSKGLNALMQLID